MTKRKRTWWLIGSAMTLAALVALVIWLRQRAAAEIRSHRFDALIEQAAQRHGVDPDLVKAVVRTESRFEPNVVGDAGEIGLMQLTADACADWARLNRREAPQPSMLYDPALNIEIGTWYLARGLRQWAHHPDGEVLALVQYNAGRTRARRLAGQTEKIVLASIPIATTRAYISRVLKYRSEYQQARAAGRHRGKAETTHT